MLLDKHGVVYNSWPINGVAENEAIRYYEKTPCLKIGLYPELWQFIRPVFYLSINSVTNKHSSVS